MFVRPEGIAGEQGARLMARGGAPMARAAVRLLGLDDPAAQVLEVGSGPGVGLATLTEQVPQGRVTGVDPSALMRRHATRRNADAIAGGRIVLLDGTADALPLPEASMDAAMMIDNLHFWPDPIAGLHEIARVLRPDSPVVCAFTPPSGGPPYGLSSTFATAGYTDLSEHRTRTGHLLRALSP